MTNVEKVVKAIQDKKYTITRYPCRASIEIYEADFKRFEGNVVELENATYRTSLKYTLFIADDDSMPDVLWFKEPYDRVTILGEFYI